MAQTTVAFEDYQAGRLPDVCVISGARTEDRMIIRTPIAPEVTGTRKAGRMLGSMDRLVTSLDPRKPREYLLGRLPVDAAILRRRRLELRVWRVVAAAAVLALVAAAWVAAALSPLAVVVSIAVLAVASQRRAELRRKAPRPTLIGAATRVHLDNVHQEFVDALAERQAN
ncbi:MAG: hypothetical protein OEQ47_02020 [Acidimicrobiia bacterium]|nr:hypothetical protein [Acidimicrobiia bacterium]